MATDLYLGYRNDDVNTPFGKFFNPEMAALPTHVVEALQHGLQGGMALVAFDHAATVADAGYQQTENGYGVLDDGSYQVSVRTDMPGVTPAMWSWWFGWHGSDTRRYKLWHPRAHLSAAWKDGEDNDDAGRPRAQRYIGRLGGPYIAVRNAPGVASRAVRPIAARILGNAETNARNLLVHCAQEMNHLADFLPELYAAFGDE